MADELNIADRKIKGIRSFFSAIWVINLKKTTAANTKKPVRNTKEN